MQDDSTIIVRAADLEGVDGRSVGRLVEDYLRQTEMEKSGHLGASAGYHGRGGGELPARYRAEVDDPRRAYADASVMLAELEGAAVGVVVVQQAADAVEIKRLWVDPVARGRRVGSALLDAAIRQHGQGVPIRLTVWDWRQDAVKLYRSRGFVPVASWDDRPRLLCFERQISRAS